ncbi:MAG: type 2 lantipeptide synthetase LanM, partial [Myxococcaceae bacterium]
IQQWVHVSLEFLTHAVDDAAILTRRFGELGQWVNIEGNAGDRHRNGRSVSIVTFSSGLRLVHKPKAMAVDARFQHLLEWLNQRGATPDFRLMEVLDRGEYGWTEFIPATPCESKDALQRFYQRQGGYLALLYVLGASDFHYENLIAAGESPVLIDLEGLLQPLRSTRRDSGSMESVAYRLFDDSLFRTMLLPLRQRAGGESAGIDLSGLGTPEGQLTPRKVQAWDDFYTDTMHMVRKRVPVYGAQNQPRFQAAPADPGQHVEELRAGFRTTYALLARNRDELLSDSGPLAGFAGAEIRTIMRPTHFYVTLRNESYHPDLLRDAVERERILDHLWSIVPGEPHLLEQLHH